MFSAGCITVGSIGIVLAYKAGLHSKFYALVKSTIEKVALSSFYCGYNEIDPKIALQRKTELVKKYQAEEVSVENHQGKKIDAVYIRHRGQLATGNVLVLCLNTTYLDHHPSRWEPFWKSGADVLLWNPTTLGPKPYAEDLQAVLKSLREKNPNQVIGLKSYCASSDPAISAAAARKDPNVHLIVDRGHGDVKKLARSFTILSSLPIVQTVLEESFDCKGVEKIKNIAGKMLFFIPGQLDQVMDCGKGNLTKDLHNQKPDETLVKLKGHDHWSDWTFNTYNEALNFLAKVGVVHNKHSPVKEEDYPEAPPLGCFPQKCVPFLTKSWF